MRPRLTLYFAAAAAAAICSGLVLWIFSPLSEASVNGGAASAPALKSKAAMPILPEVGVVKKALHANSMAPPDFNRDIRAVLSGDSTDLLEIYRRGRESKLPEEKYLAFRAYDLCRAYVRRTSYPPLDSYPDGDSMRRATAIQAAMNQRCAGFASEGLTEFIEQGRQLMAWYVDEDNPMSPNFVELPRGAGPEQVEQVRLRWADLIQRHGASAIAGREGSFAYFMEFAANQQDAGAPGTVKMLSREDMAAASLALCNAGFDCSATSNLYGVTCGVHGSCEPSLEQTYLHGLNAESAAAVKARAQTLAQALVKRDLVALGLSAKKP